MTVRILVGHVLDLLPTLDEGSIQTCVTSPPYWGLRAYGTEYQVWKNPDGTPLCGSHEWSRDGRRPMTAGHGAASAKQVTNAGTQFGNDCVFGTESVQHLRGADPGPKARAGNTTNTDARIYEVKQGAFCERCGAWRGELGSEPTPDLYIAHMVDIFRAVRRVLRDDGTLWVNMGDSYAGSPNGRSAADTKALGKDDRTFRDKPLNTAVSGIKQKDLCGMPWMLAFALRADGWYLRSDIIWAKPNPMPESVTDRPTKAHEYIFLLSKRPRYFYDADAIAEPALHAGDVVKLTPQSFAARQMIGAGVTVSGNGLAETYEVPATRNKRSVWWVNPAPFTEAHFATFPPMLIEPCIKAGAPKGATVLDIFGGAGTTGLMADRLERDAILLELNPRYAAMAERRMNSDAPMLGVVATLQKPVFQPLDLFSFAGAEVNPPKATEELSLEERFPVPF